jgi:hypothetical protein
MRKPEASDEALVRCMAEGLIKKQQEVDTKKVKGMLRQANTDIHQGKKLIKATAQKEEGWSTIYKLYYDALHELIDAFLLFDGVKSNNHWCAFAYLCEKHPELELNWEFFEKIRTARNGIVYYGKPISYKDWKGVELQINLYIDAVKKVIEGKLSS